MTQSAKARSVDEPKRESFIGRAVDGIFGYDFFLSYSHGDGMMLPRRLKERLEQAGFHVFLDQTEYVAGLDLRRETRRQVVKSRKIVVIARARALRSEWVAREVEVALAHGKVPVIVSVNGAVETAPEDAALATMARERHWLRLIENLPDSDGEPSERIVSELVRGFNHTRQETKRQRIFATAAAVLAITAGVATWQAIEATRARTIAEAQRDRAERVLDQITGNAYRRVDSLSLQLKRERQRSHAEQKPLMRAVSQPAEPVDPSPLRQADDLMKEAAALLADKEHGAARASFEQAQRLLEVETEPDWTSPRWQLARFKVYTGLADAALRGGDPDSALATLTRALAFVQRRAAASPEASDWRARQAVLHQGLGKVHLSQGRLALARQHYRDSIAAWRGLASTPAAMPGAQRELGLALRRLGDVEIQLLNRDTALALYEECASVLEGLDGLASRDPDRLGDLGSSYERRADALALLGREQEALQVYGKAIALFEAGAAAEVGEPTWQRNAAAMLQKVGELQRKMGEPEDALRSFRRVLSLREGLPVWDPEWQRELEVAYRQISEAMRPLVGREAAALESAEQYLLAASFTADLSQVDRVGRALGTLSWAALLARDFTRAEWAGRHAVDLAPEHDWVRANHAHALMMSGHPEKAREIYLKGAARSAEDARAWKDQVLKDFGEMKKRAIDNNLMTEIGARFVE